MKPICYRIALSRLYWLKSAEVPCLCMGLEVASMKVRYPYTHPHTHRNTDKQTHTQTSKHIYVDTQKDIYLIFEKS